MTTRTHSSEERLEKSTDINGELERKGKERKGKGRKGKNEKGKERSSISANEVSAANTLL